ncbi:MAG: Gfo/Idh/MocA family oxidoreductase [Anaerolineae bacterium]
MIGVGIIGTGGIARTHLRGYSYLVDEGVRVVAVCDTISERAREFAAPIGADVYQDYRELLARQDVRIVSICTPSFTHYEISADALRAGKAVLCEKPVASSLRELDELSRLEQAYGGPFNSIFQYRYAPMFHGLRTLMEQGLTGRLLSVQVDVLWHRDEAYYSVPWRGKWATELGGALTTLAIHSIDAMVALAGPATRLAAEADTLNHDIEVEDTASITLRFASGAIGTIHATSCNHTNISQVRYIFEHCTATSHLRPYDPYALPWTIESASSEREQAIREALEKMELDRFPEQHDAQFIDFVRCIRDGRRPPVTIEAIRPTFEVLTAIYKSADTHAFVELPIAPDDPYYDGAARLHTAAASS